MTSVATHAMAPQLYTNPGYDAIKDFSAVTLLATTPMLLSVSAGLPYKTLQDVIAAAKASPGKLSYASGGNGTPPHCRPPSSPRKPASRWCTCRTRAAAPRWST